MKPRTLAISGLIAAVYTVVALILAPISFGVYQVRVSEVLTVLPFITPAAIPGLFVGCLLANIFGGMGWQDIVFGSLLTLIAALMTRGTFHMSRRRFFDFLAMAIAFLWVGALVILLKTEAWWTAAILPAISIVSLFISEKWRSENKAATRVSIARGFSLGVLIYLGYRLTDQPETITLVMGLVTLLGAWVATWVQFWLRFKNHNMNLLLAPLPPVLVNAFGVSWYLAPIIGVEYWFAVQMIAVGQLIACYALGLPLLLLMEKRKAYFFN